MPSLSDLVGTHIVIRSIPIDEEKAVSVKLHAVEAAGLWIESKQSMETLLQAAKRTSAPKTLVFFVPFSQISWIMSAVDEPYLSDSILK
jgi:hypothetical protein